MVGDNFSYFMGFVTIVYVSFLIFKFGVSRYVGFWFTVKICSVLCVCCFYIGFSLAFLYFLLFLVFSGVVF